MPIHPASPAGPSVPTVQFPGCRARADRSSSFSGGNRPLQGACRESRLRTCDELAERLERFGAPGAARQLRENRSVRQEDKPVVRRCRVDGESHWGQHRSRSSCGRSRWSSARALRVPSVFCPTEPGSPTLTPLAPHSVTPHGITVRRERPLTALREALTTDELAGCASQTGERRSQTARSTGAPRSLLAKTHGMPARRSCN